MKPIRRPLSLAVLASLFALGCGGSGTKTTAPNGNRAAIAQSIKGAATTSTTIKDGAPGRSRKELRPTAPNVALPLSREEGDLEVGSPIGVSPDLWGRVTEVEYATVAGARRIALLNFDIFDDPDYTNLVGYERTENRTNGPETTYLAESKFTNGAYSPRDYRMFTLTNTESGRVVQEASDMGREETSPGEYRTYRYSTRFEMPRAGEPTTFVSQFRNDDIDYNSSGTYFADGTLEMVWVNTAGYQITWTSRPDGTGSFRIENASDSLCPATGSYDAEGKGVITFADGSTENFDLYTSEFWR